jgi:outer membrane protein OmpA-like peptidoglycan-associated protein
MKNILLIFCTLFSAIRGYSQAKDTFEVYFPFNVPKMTVEAEAYIDKLIFNDTLIHGNKLIVLGFADYVGGKGHNDTLSRLRANNIRDYLMKMGFAKNDITICIGKGKIERTNIKGREGFAPDRKVQIIIDRSAPAVVAAPVPPLPKQKIDIKQLKVNQAFALNNINFQPGLPTLLPESFPDLEKLLTFLEENPSVKIRVEGHVCCLGAEEGKDMPYADGNLSQYRAMAIQRYLIDKGIIAGRVKAIGLGNVNPVVKDEVTEDDRIKNRRVEIRITSK